MDPDTEEVDQKSLSVVGPVIEPLQSQDCWIISTLLSRSQQKQQQPLQSQRAAQSSITNSLTSFFLKDIQLTLEIMFTLGHY